MKVRYPIFFLLFMTALGNGCNQQDPATHIPANDTSGTEVPCDEKLDNEDVLEVSESKVNGDESLGLTGNTGCSLDE